MKKLLCVLFLSILSYSSQAQGGAGQQMEVMMKMATLRSALLNKDSATLAGLLSDDVTYGHSNGLLQTKAQLIRAVVSREQDYKAIDPSDMNIRLYGQSAVVTLLSKVSMVYQGKALDLTMNLLLVWIRVNNDWKLVARQSVKL